MNIASVMSNLKYFDDRGSYREQASDTLIVISLTHRDVYIIMHGALRPDIAAASTETPPLPLLSDIDTDRAT